MRIVEVIESRVWVNRITGMKVSPNGACPWHSEADRGNWSMRVVGYTWRLSNGTIGLGCVPAKTREEAEERMLRFNSRLG